jgi:hypothetical protein
MSTTITNTLVFEKTLGPLTAEQRQTIMEQAVALTPAARPLFRRLLILAQERGVDAEVIARAASQAREHDAAFR